MVTKTDHTASTTEQESRTKSPVRYLVIAALLLLLAWAGIKTYRIATAVNGLLNLQAKAETIMPGGINTIEPREAQTLIMDARQHIQTIKRETTILMPFTPYFGWLPEIGPLVTDAPQLMEMAGAGSETAAFLIRGTGPLLTIMQNEGIDNTEKLPALIATLASARPDIIEANRSFDSYLTARSLLTREGEYPQQIQALLTKADNYTPLASDGLKLAQVLPQIMGHNGRRTYLLVAQNEDELRATGGFFSGVGTLVVENGRILELSFEDASLIQDWANKPYDFPPQPLYDFMQSELFLFRDANFWPDFPTSAEAGLELYEYTTESPPIDGMIAIDQTFMKILLQATGPVTVPGSNITLTHKNMIDNIRNSWNASEGESNREWFNTRKDFMGIFALGVRQRLEKEFDQVDPVYFVQLMHEAIESKHLQLYLRDPLEAAILDEIGWDGRLENPAQQDYLFVVDNNMGFNKSNIYVTRAIDYHLTLHQDGSGEAKLSINYTHEAASKEKSCSQGVAYKNAPTYLEIADRCYFNYVRVYVPANSQLLESSTHFVPAEQLIRSEDWSGTATTVNEFSDFSTFANFFVLPQGKRQSVQFYYRLPARLVTESNGNNRYHLTLPKQAGTDQDTATIIITLPPNATFVGSTPAATAVDDNTITFTINLKTDYEIELFYR